LLSCVPCSAYLLQTNLEYGCFNPLRDICVPGNTGQSPMLVGMAYSDKKSPYYNTSLINTTLFFAGGWPAYAPVHA
jgi:hypothetical protein